eukprot:gene11-17_t
MQTISSWLAGESDDGLGERVMNTCETVLKPTTLKDRGGRLQQVKGQIFKEMFFDQDTTFAEHITPHFKGVYRGKHAEDQTDTTLKISEVVSSQVEAIKNLRYLKEENLKAINECIWYQQLHTSHAHTDQAIAHVIDSRVFRCPSNWVDKPSVFVCLHLKCYDITLADWLKESDRPKQMRADYTPLGSGDGYAMAVDDAFNARFNKTLRRIVLHTVCFLNWIQRSHAAVHHDMHANNVLLRHHPEDGVLPVFIDFELMEGRVYGNLPASAETPSANETAGDKSPPWSGHLFGVYGHAYANGLTCSYDCYRLFSDLLHIINLQNLTPYIDPELLRFVRKRTSARFDDARAQELHAESMSTPTCGEYWDMMWQPHLLTSADDPKTMLMWNAFVRKELEDALGSSGKCLQSMIPLESRVKILRHLHLARACFSLGSPNAWLRVASDLDLFLLPSMMTEDMLHNTVSMRQILEQVVRSMICDWDDSSEPYLWQLNRGNRAVTPGIHFVRLHMIQTTMLAFYHWLHAEHSHRLQRRKRKIAEIGERIGKHPIPLPTVTPENQYQALAVILTAIVPFKYVHQTLKNLGAPGRIDNAHDTEILSKTRVDDWIRSGMIRCMPVLCISVPHEQRDELNTNRQLMAIALLCTDRSMYYKTPTSSFLQQFADRVSLSSNSRTVRR